MVIQRFDCPACPYETPDAAALAEHRIISHDWRPEEGQQAAAPGGKTK